MPSTPYAKLLVTVNGGAPLSGAIYPSVGDVIRLSAESTAFWNQQKFEVYDFPEGFALPAGWSDSGTGSYFYATDPFPPPFTVGPWGKFMLRLTVNNGLNGAGKTDQTLVDATTALSIYSPIGLADLGFLEDTQFSPQREWTFDQKANLRALETAIAAAGGVPPSRTISTSAPLTGGGNLSADRTLGISPATDSSAGSMSGADKTKLDGIEAGAQAVTFAHVKAALGGATSTVTFNGQEIKVGVPVDPNGAATKGYVDMRDSVLAEPIDIAAQTHSDGVFSYWLFQTRVDGTFVVTITEVGGPGVAADDANYWSFILEKNGSILATGATTQTIGSGGVGDLATNTPVILYNGLSVVAGDTIMLLIAPTALAPALGVGKVAVLFTPA